MARRERPLDTGEGPLLLFAADLRALRTKANSPAYRELARRAHYSAATLSEAASGRKLPTLAVTLAYVRACDGDVTEWERRWHHVAAELAEDLSQRRKDDEDPPYAGLASLQQADAGKFFGRARLVDEILSRLTARHLIAVFGASGAGKSSVLRAGVLAGWTGPRRAAFLCTPTEHPLRQLDTLPKADEVLVIVDQFEELFTLCADPQERERFIRRLVGLASSADGGYRVVLGVRADFYSQCMESPILVTALQDAQVVAGPMTTEELREAIVQPATRAGCTVESALLTTLIAQAQGQAGILPLVSHALLETWRRRRGNTLTLEGYRAAGGIEGALAKTAEEVYGSLTPEQRSRVRRLFLRLTTFGDETADAKVRVTRDELGDDEDAALLERLAAARLLVIDRNTVEVAHEALLRSWPRLAGWLSEDRENLRTHRLLGEAARLWESLAREPGALYRGSRLHAAVELAKLHPGALTAREREFLEASRAASAAEAAKDRRHQQRLRQLVAVLSVLLVVAVAATAYALRAEADASQERNIAVSQRVAIEVEALRTADPALAAQLALAAYRLAPTPEARSALLSTSGIPYATRLTGHSAAVGGVAYSADGHLLATASMDHTIRLWQAGDPHHPRELATLTGHTGGVNAVAVGTRAVTAVSWDHTVRVWDISDPARPSAPATLTGHTDGVHALALSRDGRVLATGSTDRTVRLWDLGDPRHPVPLGGPLTGHTDAVLAVAIRPDGRVLATAGIDRTVRLWDLTDPRHPAVLSDTPAGHTDPIGAVVFSPDGRRLATGSADHTIRLWDAADPRHPVLAAVASGHTDAVRALAFDPTGRTLASASLDRTARLWDVSARDPVELTVYRGHTGPLYGIAFSPDGRTLATTGEDHTARLWDLPGPLLATHADAVYGVALSPDGRIFASGGYDGVIRVRDVRDLWRPGPDVVLREHTGPVNAVAFRPGGQALASASADTTVRFWNTRGTAAGAPLTAHTKAVNALAFSPDGRLLATGGSDHDLLIWDLTGSGPPRPIVVLLDNTDGVNAIAFSADGHKVATAGRDRFARVWDITDPGHPAGPVTLQGHDETLKSVAFSPRGHLLATAGADRVVRLWDLDDPAHPSVPIPHTDVVHAVTFGADGQTLATAGADRVIRLWNLADWRRPVKTAELAGHTDRVYALAFGTDGHTLISGGQDHTARLWDVDPERVADRVCAITGAVLTRTNWDRYFPGIGYRPPC
ncbi:hypothetical protein ILP97_31730 [Amycolatopsis sp. H6(2020)]|nr:hypothetical protein [Amycolatopsis sp. H6(2020)]